MFGQISNHEYFYCNLFQTKYMINIWFFFCIYLQFLYILSANIKVCVWEHADLSSKGGSRVSPCSWRLLKVDVSSLTQGVCVFPVLTRGRTQVKAESIYIQILVKTINHLKLSIPRKKKFNTYQLSIKRQKCFLAKKNLLNTSSKCNALCLLKKEEEKIWHPHFFLTAKDFLNLFFR